MADQPPHAVPEDATGLAAPGQRAMPVVAHLEPKDVQRGSVHGHAIVAKMPTHDRAQPLPHFRDGIMHTPSKLGLHFVELRLQPLAHRLPQHRKHSIAPLPHANMRKAEEVERLRLPFSAALPVADRKRTKLQQARFLGMQFELELSESLLQFRLEPFGIRLHLEAHHDVIGEAHDDHVAARPLLTPRLDPQVEDIMEVDVRQERRNDGLNAKGNVDRVGALAAVEAREVAVAYLANPVRHSVSGSNGGWSEYPSPPRPLSRAIAGFSAAH